MQFNKKKFFLVFLIIILIPNYINFLLVNKSIKFLNKLYFNLPFIIYRNKKCKNYDNIIRKYIDKSISITLIDEKGSVISSYNDDILRIAASNIKLVSTAYVLNKYKLYHTFNTKIYTNGKNEYYIIGSGDPDFSEYELLELISKIKFNDKINISIFEIPLNKQWPKGWTDIDKLYEYGSPISLLALESNSVKQRDIFHMKNIIYNYLNNKFPTAKINISILNYKGAYFKKENLLYEIKSNPLISLITLANAESHNFTAESIFKNASKTWNLNDYSVLKKWLRSKGLNDNRLYFSDASGLSRNNRVTTKSLALFLHKMRYRSDFSIYKSSLSILGIRGTLGNRMINSAVKGKFIGKTGTLSNVFALSGYLKKEDETITLSIIQNNEEVSFNKIFNLLDEIYKVKKCN